MNKLIMTAAVLVLSLPAQAQSIDEKSGINSALGLAPKTEDFCQRRCDQRYVRNRVEPTYRREGDKADN